MTAIKCCQSCVKKYKEYKALHKNSGESKNLRFEMEHCPNDCWMYLTAPNCKVDDEGNVSIDNSKRKY